MKSSKINCNRQCNNAKRTCYEKSSKALSVSVK